MRRPVDSLRSGQLAEAGGVHVETLRYYERRGLLAEPPRRDSGYRDYPVDAIHRLRMIKQAQGLGLRLEEIAALSDLRSSLDSLLYACCDGRQSEQACPALGQDRSYG